MFSGRKQDHFISIACVYIFNHSNKHIEEGAKIGGSFRYIGYELEVLCDIRRYHGQRGKSAIRKFQLAQERRSELI